MFSPVNSLLGLFSRDISIDLGTANTLVLVRGVGIVIREPSIVAIEKRTKRVLAIGSEAKGMLGRTPSDIAVVRPLRDGVISDFDVTAKMLEYFISRVHNHALLPLPARPRMVIGIPSGVTEVEKRAVHDAAMNAGAREVYLIEEPTASAIGTGLPITETVGSMIVDIGGGTTEMAVFSLGGIVTSRSIRVAGDEMDEEIIRYAREKYNVLIGERHAEEIKFVVGSAFPLPEERTTLMRGRNLITGLPESFEVSSIEIREALANPLNQIIDALKATLDETPPELVSDLMENGIAIAGGGALLGGIANRLTQEVKIRVYVADDPLTCVVRGGGIVLEELDTLRNVISNTRRPPPRR